MESLWSLPGLVVRYGFLFFSFSALQLLLQQAVSLAQGEKMRPSINFALQH